MTLDEFDALQLGDQVANGEGHTADVTAKGDWGVTIKWGNRTGPSFTLWRAGTLWFGLEKVQKPERVTCDRCHTEFTVSGGAPCPTCAQS